MANQYFLARIAGRDPNLRASDADRERIAERLRKSHAEGRLDLAEFQQRLERCYESKTVGELGELVNDLPREDDQEERRSLGHVNSWHWGLARLAMLMFALLVFSAAIWHHAVLVWVLVLFVLWRLSWRRHRRWSTAARRGPNDWI